VNATADPAKNLLRFKQAACSGIGCFPLNIQLRKNIRLPPKKQTETLVRHHFFGVVAAKESLPASASWRTSLSSRKEPSENRCMQLKYAVPIFIILLCQRAVLGGCYAIPRLKG
jgi:hypothetical protein